MFLYITGIKNKKEALSAIKKGANAIGVELGYKESALAAENCRTWLEELPFHILKAGIFQNEEYYNVEEMASFCHLDIIHLKDKAKLKDFSHYSGRLIVETDYQNWEGIKANGYVIKLTSVSEAKKLSVSKIKLPVLLTGNFNLHEWQDILDYYTPAGISLDVAFVNDMSKLIAYR